jgi:hypothetical protein
MNRENLFMINIDNDDSSIDREEFVIRRENAQIKSDRAELDEKMIKAIHKTVFGAHSVFMIFSCLFLLLGIYLGFVTLTDYFDSKTVPTLPLCLTCVFLVLSGIFAIFKKMFEKKSEENSPVNALDQSYARLNEISRRDLGVPSDAETAEIFCHFYDCDFSSDEPYNVDTVTVFEEDGKLCLHHVGVVVAVPINSIESVVKLSDPVIFSDWTKDESHDSAEYLQYNIQKKQVDELHEEYSMRGCYSIRFTSDNTPMEILVPPYEIKPFFDILKLELTEE